ncbi:MAG: ammonia-forming cytochrome c nitrite reductase subunit c552 [Planctomycetota bacterium]|nr:ammonia-forming cytochrome c nitrite reductase subunit c552 [Planctomycetota bacterium]
MRTPSFLSSNAAMSDQRANRGAGLRARAGVSRTAMLLWLAGVGGIAGGVAAMLLYHNISQRKREATSTVTQVVELTERTVDPAEWGKNYPRQYDGYVRTAINPRARFSWSDGAPPLNSTSADAPERVESADQDSIGDPHSKKAESKLEGDPHLRTIFNGYAFAIDYRERRGHAFMLQDQQETERVKQRPQPATCLNCHASTVVAFREAGLSQGAPGTLDDPLLSAQGQQQLFKGWEHVNPMPYAEGSKLVSHPVTCLDCHDPKTLRLRITRPAFIEGIANLAASDDPLPHLPSVEQWRRGNRAQPYDPNALASRQEMRSMSCAQCHVEYYFKGDQKRLTFPWHNGLKIEQIEGYYDAVGWKDWTHADSGSAVIKAQHPEFELWSQGIHARSGVSCADCHMPYKREGAVKFSDHQVKTPLADVARSCQTCHQYNESELLARVDAIQQRTKGQLDRAELAVVQLIRSIASAKAAGASDEQLAAARDLQRRAQWRADFMNAENSMGFHAPAESLRILGEAIDFARQGIVEAVRAGGTPPAPEPR